ncbi:hypothetical protein C1646_662995 [Rhizophagus diaphanus]|nr:hypothetical protein C1646_662995 [Rhizophagus diaphanus] [Rhizophagus sp. MUCL 43196]
MTDDLLRITDSPQAEGTSINLPTQIRSKEDHIWHENLGILIPMTSSLIQEQLKGKQYPPGYKEWFTNIRAWKKQHEVMNEDDSHYRYKGHTSDDTKLLKLCPHK